MNNDEIYEDDSMNENVSDEVMNTDEQLSDEDFSPETKNNQTDLVEVENDTESEINVSSENDITEEDNDEISEYYEEEYEGIPRKKLGKKGIIYIVISLIILILIYLVSFSEHPVAKTYRKNFMTNISVIDEKLGISRSIEKITGKKIKDELKKREDYKAKGTTYDNESYMIPFENASGSVYANINGEIAVAKSNYLVFFTDSGEKVLELTTSVVNPVIATDGNYMVIAEKGGTKINMFSDKKLVFSADAQNEILNINLSSNGDVVVVTKKELYKGAVEVFNKNGERVYDWSSGKDTIVCADISPSGRKLAIGFLSSSESVSAGIKFFDIKQPESFKTIEIPGTVVYRLEFSGELLNVFGDNRFVGLNLKGKILWDEVYEDEKLSLSDMADNGVKVLLSEYNNLPVIRIYSKRGRVQNEVSLERLPDFIDVSDSRILYNNSRMINFGKYGRTRSYPATMDIKNLMIVDSDTFLVVYSNSIEFIEA